MGETAWVKSDDAANEPVSLVLFLNGLKASTSGGGRDDVVAVMLDLHLWAGEVPTDVEGDEHGVARGEFSGNI